MPRKSNVKFIGEPKELSEANTVYQLSLEKSGNRVMLVAKCVRSREVDGKQDIRISIAGDTADIIYNIT